MRKSKWMWIGVMVSLLTVPAFAQAGSRYTDGFRGIAWGTHKDQLPDLGLSKKALGRIYKSGPSAVMFMEGQGNLAMDFSGVALKSIFLRFEDQRFSGADLIFSPADRAKIHSVLAAEMGSQGKSRDGAVQWTAAGLVIELTERELLVAHHPR